MVKVHTTSQTAKFTKAISKTTNATELDPCFIQMERGMKAIGVKERRMAKEPISSRMDHFTTVFIKMAKSITKANSSTAQLQSNK